VLGKYLAVEKVSLDVSSDLLLPPISIAQQFLFVIQQLLVGLCRELKVGSLNNGIHRTCLLTEATVDALGHVNIISCGSSASVSPHLCFNCDSLLAAKESCRMEEAAGDNSRKCDEQKTTASGDGFSFSSNLSLEEIRALQERFAVERDWEKYHTPRNLMLAMVCY